MTTPGGRNMLVSMGTKTVVFLQYMWCKLRGAIYAVHSMWRELRGVSYARASTFLGPLWIMGAPFFRQFYTTFEVPGRSNDNWTVHIAKASDTCHPASLDEHPRFLPRSRSSTGSSEVGEGPPRCQI